MRVDFSALHTHWQRLTVFTMVACAALLAVQVTVVAGTRLKLVLECLNAKAPLGLTWKVALGGFFFEQVAFGFVGGDAMRLWLLRRIDTPGVKAFQALLIDRCLGFVALFFLVLLGLPGLRRLVPDPDGQTQIAWGVGAIVLLGGAMLAVALLMPAKYRRHPWLSGLGQVALGTLRDPYITRRLLLVFALATTIQLLNVVIMFLVGLSLGLGINLTQWFVVVPAALLFSMIPISAGGWGLREGMLVYALQGLGTPPEAAVVPPIVFGLGTLMVTLPGGLIWLANRQTRRPDAPAGETEGTPGRESTATLARERQ